VVFHDAECLAVDSGPDVVNRKAARSCGRNAAERKAIVIDRFFYTKERALAWANANPHFMMVRVRAPDTEAPYYSSYRTPVRCDSASSGMHPADLSSDRKNFGIKF